MSKNPQKIKDFYDSKFPDSSFNVTMRDFRPNQTQLIKRIARWKDDSKEPYFKTFNATNWLLLSSDEKSAHSRTNCLECERKHKPLQELFKDRCFGKMKRRSKENINPDLPCTPSRKSLISATAANSFTTSTPLTTSTLSKTSTPLTNSKSHATLNASQELTPVPREPSLTDRRKCEERYRKKVEQKYAKDYRDLDAVLAHRLSFSCYDSFRKSLLLESHDDAYQRVINTPKRRRVAWEHKTFNRQGVLEKVSTLAKVNKII